MQRPISSHMIALLFSMIFASGAPAEMRVRTVQVSAPSEPSHVPAVTAMGRVLAPQAVSIVDVSADGKFITVGTMAFRHDANVWQLSPEGTVLAKKNLPPWAPMQVTTLAGGNAMAVGLAYSRVTSPAPTVWLGSTDDLLRNPLSEKLAEGDTRTTFDKPTGDQPLAGGEPWLRPGSGEWRSGWLASELDELFVHGPDWVYTPPDLLLHSDGRRERLRVEDGNALPTNRATRMAASRDGKRVAFGWLTRRPSAEGQQPPRLAVSVWGVNPNRPLWSATASEDLSAPELPNPAADFPELEKDGFRLAADVVAPGAVSAAIAISADGSRVAIIEYAVRVWLRNGAVVGKWDPPIHALNFIPKQRGRLRVFDGEGKELLREFLPQAGMFEVGFGAGSDHLWCWPASWFARGMAGAVWLPVDHEARNVYRISIPDREAVAMSVADAIADCAPSPADHRALISCWDGQISLVNADGNIMSKWEVGAPARLTWSPDGSFAIAGTSDGNLLRLERDGKLAWKQSVPIADPPTVSMPAQVIEGIPIYEGGQIRPSESAYAGNIWIVKLGREAVLVDAGGISNFSITQARLRALGIDRVTHVLHTHSHGDHCGGAYLWRCAGAKIVAPKSAELTMTWLMPMMTDYGLYPPRPVDVPLPLSRAGDETEFTVSGQKFRALFVPGHSFDSTIYMTELSGKRVAFTGDVGFDRQTDIVHRAWGDVEKARPVVKAIRENLLPWRPDAVFTGHGTRRNGTAWVEDLVRRSEATLSNVPVKDGRK